MTARRGEAATPGYGDRVRVISSTSGREWSGEVLVWLATGSPQVRDDVTAAVRYYPPDWIAEVIDGPGPGPCECPIIAMDSTGVPGADWPVAEQNPECPHHGDPAAILRKARA